MLALRPLIGIRNIASKIIARRYEQTDWKPATPGSLDELEKFCKEKVKYKADPARGLMDHIQPVKHMNWQLENRGHIEGDCDDISTYVAYMLRNMGYKEIYRVNIARYLHVICVFKTDEVYRYFTNQYLRSGTFNSVKEAADHWCKSHEHKPTRVYYAERL